MIITRISRRALAMVLALSVVAPWLVSTKASAQTPFFEYKGDCRSRLNDQFGFGVLSIMTPTPGGPNVVKVSYFFGQTGRTIDSGFRFYYSTPEGPFPIPRAAIATAETIKGSFEVPAVTGPHRIQIVIGYVGTGGFDEIYGVRLTCETTVDVVSLTTTTVFTQNKGKLVTPRVVTPKDGSTAVLNSGVALASVGPVLTTTTKPTVTTIAPTTAPVATTTTVGVATTVTPTIAPTATATTTPAATTPATTAAPTSSSTAAPVTVAAAANSVTKKTKAKRTVKKRKTTKKPKRPATTVKR